MNHPDLGMTGDDYRLYVDAARSWLSGGSFYVPAQVAAPYDIPWGQILYPPQALALFVPFTFLGTWGGVPFVAIPTLIIARMVVSHRPRPWAWAVICGLLIVFPLTVLMWAAGSPTLWVIALVALATRWPWVSALIWFKPSVFPFALIGIRDRRWWVVAAGLVLAGLVMWPLTSDWLHVLLNARGGNSGLFYSLSPASLIGPLIPIVASRGSSPAGR